MMRKYVVAQRFVKGYKKERSRKSLGGGGVKPG
jgi:hypothetical protein